MRNYRSTGYCTCNENGLFQVELVYENGFFRSLFGMKEVKEVYEGDGRNFWKEKLSGYGACQNKASEILSVLTNLYYANRIDRYDLLMRNRSHRDKQILESYLK